MALLDFIIEPIKGIVTTVTGFFNAGFDAVGDVIGFEGSEVKAAAKKLLKKSIRGEEPPPFRFDKVSQAQLSAGLITTTRTRASGATSTTPIQSVDASALERNWLNRTNSFANIVQRTKTQI